MIIFPIKHIKPMVHLWIDSRGNEGTFTQKKPNLRMVQQQLWHLIVDYLTFLNLKVVILCTWMNVCKQFILIGKLHLQLLWLCANTSGDHVAKRSQTSRFPSLFCVWPTGFQWNVLFVQFVCLYDKYLFKFLHNPLCVAGTLEKLKNQNKHSRKTLSSWEINDKKRPLCMLNIKQKLAPC